MPHLQRPDPAGERLATYDTNARTIVLTPIDGHGGPGQRITIADEIGSPASMRWTADSSGLLIATNSELYLVPIHDDATKASPVPLLASAIGRELRIRDVRTVADGAMVRAEFAAPDASFTEPLEGRSADLLGGGRVPSPRFSLGWELADQNAELDHAPRRGQVFYLRLADETVQELTPLLPADKSATSAMPLRDGRIAVAISDWDAADPWSGDSTDQMWIAEAPRGGWWSKIEKRSCDDDECSAQNWAPGAKAPIFATFEDVFIDGKKLAHEFDGVIETLWVHPKTDHVLASTGNELVVTDAGGAVLWRYEPKGDEKIRSAHFVGDAVLAATDTQVVRLVNGEATRVLAIRGYSRTKGTEGSEKNGWVWRSRHRERRLDAIVPLPGGAFAYSILDLDETEESL